MDRIRTSAIAIAERRLGPGKVSDYIKHSADLAPGTRVFLVARVSPETHGDRSNDSLSIQLAALHREAIRRQFVVVGEYADVWSGNEPAWLVRPVHKAKSAGADAMMFIQPDRPIRGRWLKREKRYALPTEADLKDMAYWAGGMQIVTVLHADATQAEQASTRVKRGHRARGNKGGGDRNPGYKKRRRERLEHVVQKLHSRGLTLRQIEAATNVHYRTVYDWVR